MPPSNSSTTLVTAAVAVAAFCGGSLLTAAYFHFATKENKEKAKNNQRPSFPATQKKCYTNTTSTSTSNTTTTTSIQYPSYDYETDPIGSFKKIGDWLVTEIIHELPEQYHLPQRETEWIEKMLNYTVQGGKMNRGLMVVDAGVHILQLKCNTNTDDTDTNITLCRLAVLGWAIEWLQAWLLVADDIMDGSVTRRGQPCWYKTLGDAWYIAINDAVTIESLVYNQIIKKHFAYDSDLLLQLLDLLMETTLQTELGQLSDTLCDVLELPDLTPERWEWIVTYKTSFYSFYLSVAFAMVLAGVTDPEAYDAAREILVTLGVYFQAQDDYLDCYGTPEQIGKIGTDIADKKCGWLFTKAYHQLLVDNEEGKKLLDTHYGKCQVNSPEEQQIKDLYTALGLPKLYAEYEQASYDTIMDMKHSHAGATLAKAGVPWAVFESFLQKVYKRSK